MKLFAVHSALCLAFLAGLLPQISKAEAAENSGNKLRRVTEQMVDQGIKELDPAIARTIRASDLATKRDLSSRSKPIRIQVAGKGEFELLDIKSSIAGNDCRMHLPSISRALAAKGGTGSGPEWVNLSIYTIQGKTHCLWPPGGSCYAMVQKVTP